MATPSRPLSRANAHLFFAQIAVEIAGDIAAVLIAIAGVDLVGPEKDAPALVKAGMMGDRADVIFANPSEISPFIAPKC